ncbi:MAG: ROK family protein, partial [Clostridia bacterium]|nr:ROK family protein [Clostridia bacterium]
MYYIGIDLGGTNIAVGLVNEEGRIITKTETPTLASRPYEELVKDMARCAREVMEEADVAEDEIRSIGIGIPGIADKDGVVIFCTNLGWRNVPIRAEIQKYIAKPVFIDNDATVAGWAEFQAGVSRGTNSSVFVTLGTGLGAGIVINGKIWAGAHSAGSELGHITIEVDGVPCTCGKRGCVERYCSATAIIRMAREACAEAPNCAIMRTVSGDMDKINAKIVFDAAKDGDTVAMQVFNRFVKYLTIFINNVISTL